MAGSELTGTGWRQRLARVFALNRAGLAVRRGLAAIVILAVLLAALHALDLQAYALSLVFGVLFVALSDPGGPYRARLREMTLVGVVGAPLTALGFAAGTWACGLVTLAAFLITGLAGLAVTFGVHRFVGALLVNIWFLVALGAGAAAGQSRPWAQALAWLAGFALWVAATWLLWLARGRVVRTSPFPEIPGDTSPRPLTRPVIIFAVLRAVLVAGAVAIAFGLHAPNADWLPIATIVALKPSLEQSRLVAAQRLAGAILGAALATTLLLSVDSEVALGVALIVLASVAVCIRFVNYALYTGAVAATVLIAMDLPHPDDLAAEGERVLYTFVGLAIGVAGMLAADLLQKRAAIRAGRDPGGRSR
ncbi:hypothetical protein GCM10010168_28410 [Actinoplanes ianthinogenes]|uniref:Integral membrane bound transporter domain-containing protein n=1 Tax=Actinoplanes ianthinogenes TaxID=122358 RepID=A0ABM7LLD7_9ACTN|nr:FUSC family protein [Actinoplanes ianthinogenes]BCJ39983.1 hypothetical protein Aiant_06400 [Actinoplanes ianthinogenes]GGR09452.1 hypothetical protein GCM10010168_28410 [Actinoplanes ianthinogenes]